MFRVVITGGPATGKTSLIKALKESGYSTFDEVARKVIKQQLTLNTNKVPWDDIIGFSKLVLAEQIKDFKSANSDLVFYDRGIPDIIGYITHKQKELFKGLKDSSQMNRYNQVFILPPWKDIYTTDNERRENFKESELIFNEIEKAYKLSGYHPVRVPLDSTYNRMTFILNYLSD
tara:strand:+ start:115 stop:639 length:525 start_codon:yes stop_codon:yes gene_type:complete